LDSILSADHWMNINSVYFHYIQRTLGFSRVSRISISVCIRISIS